VTVQAAFAIFMHLFPRNISILCLIYQQYYTALPSVPKILLSQAVFCCTVTLQAELQVSYIHILTRILPFHVVSW